jgi:dTDP-4-dehydrorhamnose reductase
MRIAATGREGQVVRSLLERGRVADHDIIALGRPRLDLAGNLDDIVEAIVEARPDAIVSAAAFTAVDRAEAEPELALAINAKGAEAVARAANRLAVPLIHLSTDYVFDGCKASAYEEDDVTNPTSVYGKTKLAGERAVLDAHDNVVILRTAWVYSPFGSNFVKTMLRLAQERDEVRVVDDQRGNPTSAIDIAEGILAVADNLIRSPEPSRRGIFHMTGLGEASWAEFAEVILAASSSAGGPACRVRRITTKEFPTPAKRPANSRLNCHKLARAHGVRLPDWHQSTALVVARLIERSIYRVER